MINFKGVMRESDGFSKTFQLISVTGFFALMGFAFWTLFVKGRLTELESLKMLQIVQSLGTFILPSLALAYFWSKSPFSFLGLKAKVRWMDAGIVVLFMVVIIPFVNLLSDLNQQIVLPHSLAWLEVELRFAEDQVAKISEQFLSATTLTGLLYNVLLIAVLPSLAEELYFRRSVFSVFEQWKGLVAAIWLSAFVFSAIHFQFYGFIPRMLLGALMGYLYVWSGSLWIPIIAHFTNNLIAVVFYYLQSIGCSIMDLNTIGTNETFWVGCLSACLAVVGLYGLKHILTQHK